MKASDKVRSTLSPLLRIRKGVSARLVGVISKARARAWIRHIDKTRKDWN